MNYLITGGLGYIGSYLAKTLITQGNHVTIIDNATTHEFKVYEKARNALERLPKNIISIEDARDMRSDILRGIDCVIHLAALSGIEACENNIHGAKISNIELTKHVLAKCVEAEVPRIFLASTAAVYGKLKKCHETSDTITENVYAKTKLLAERIVLNEPNINGIIGRFSNVYGYGYYDKKTVMSNFAREIIDKKSPIVYGSGEQTRDFIHLNDIVSGIIFLIQHPDSGGVYNLGGGRTYKVTTAATMMNRAAKTKHKPKFNKEINSGRVEPGKGYKYDIGKIQALGWKPKVSLKQGCELLLEAISEYD